MRSSTEAVCFGRWWSEALEGAPGRPILQFDPEGSTLTRAELDEILRRFAAWYQARGLRSGDTILVDAGAGELAIGAVFGAMAIGVVPLCVPPDASRIQRERSRRLLGARLELRAVAGEEDAVGLREESTLQELAGLTPLAGLPEVPPEQDAAILFSSGTTGAARACRISHRALYHSARMFPDLSLGMPDPRVLVSTGIHTITGLRFALPVQAMHDATAVWVPASMPAPLLLLAATRHRCQFISAGPGFVLAALRDIGRLGGLEPGFPTRIWAGGGAVALEHRLEFSRRLGVEVLHTYGLTETCGTVGWWTPDASGQDRWQALPGVELRLLQRSPEDPAGQVLVRTPAAFSAYAGGGGPLDGWVETGDLGAMDAGGALRLLGRRSRAFTAPDGEKVLLDEVEAVLERVVGAPAHVGPVYAARPSLQALVEQGAEFSPGQWRALRERLPARALPARVLARPSLPRNAHGKLDRSACQAILERE